MNSTLIIGLIQNVALLLATGLVLDFFWKRNQNNDLVFSRLIAGVFLSIIGIMVMLTPAVLSPGLVFDTRSVLLSVSGMFFGLVPVVMAMVVTAAYRVYIGGDGVWMGIAVIFSSGIIGIVWHSIDGKWYNKHRNLKLIVLGFAVHLVMLGCTMFLPFNLRDKTVNSILFPLLTVYPFGTFLFGYFLFNRLRQWETKKLLRESEERFREIIESSVDIHYRQDIQSGEFVYISPSVYQILGYTPQEVLKMNLLKQRDLFFDEDLGHLESFQPDLIQSHQQNKTLELEFRMISRSGKIHWIHGSYKIKNDAQGNPAYIIGLLRDITERKKSEAFIRESYHEREMIVSNIPNIIWKSDLDSNGKFINSYISGVADEFLMLPLNTIKNDWDKYLSYVLPRYMPDIMNKIKVGLSNPGQTFSMEYEVMRSNGEIAWFLSEGRAYIENGRPRIFGFTSNITDRKYILRALKESENMFRSYIQHAPDGIYTCDATGNITGANKSLCAMLGYTEAEISLRKIFSFVTPDYQEVIGNSFGFANENDIFSNEIVFVSSNGHSFFALLSTVKISDNQYLGFIKNIDDIKKTHVELILAKEKAEESDRLKSAFLATMSHELRTPLNAVIGFSSIIDSSMTVEDIVRLVKYINRSGNHLLSIIESIFEIALLQSGNGNTENVVFNVDDFFVDLGDHVKTEIETSEKTHLTYKAVPDPHFTSLSIFSDREKLIQLLSHLLNNSVKYTLQGGIEYGYLVNNSDIIFYVKDTGVGISPDKAGIIFEQFRQGDDSDTRVFGGVGLGLAISHKLSLLLQGRLWFESIPEVGSTFYFELKNAILPDNTHVTKQAVKEPQNLIEGKTILIVDDCDDNLFYLTLMLAAYKANLLTAESGLQAIELVKHNPEISLVLMDIKLPEMNGYEVTRHIHLLRPGLPVIAQTAFAMKGDRELAIEAGCIEYISKPIRKEALIEMINNTFAR
jgi:PAS domain S-box-containing protein